MDRRPRRCAAARGILATLTVPVVEVPDDLMAPWRDDYANEPFIELSPELPSIKDVVRFILSHFADDVYNVTPEPFRGPTPREGP